MGWGWGKGAWGNVLRCGWAWIMDFEKLGPSLSENIYNTYTLLP